MKKKLLVIGACVVVCVAACAVWLYVRYQQKQKPETPEEEILNTHPTDAVDYYVEMIPTADPLIVGKWQNTANPGWYKVYYDDYDEEKKLFWGKEWDESEDVLEEDLNYHGNGWFRWEKRGKELHEYSTMDNRDVPIHRGYVIRSSTTDSLVYFEPDYKKVIFRFARI